MSGSGFQNGLIILNEPKSVYYCGQIILGQVNFELDAPLKILQLNVVYKGEANVLWTEDQTETFSGVSKIKTINYTGHQDYFNYTQCLKGENGGTMLESGAHSIPFEYQIPFKVPSSFKGDKGQVEYSVTAILIHGNGLKEEIVKKFDVIAPFDLKTDKIKAPIEMEFEDTGGWWCGGASRFVRVRTQHGGFCPGEPLIFTLQSETELKQITFEVLGRLVYKSYQPRSILSPPPDVIVSMTEGPILENKEYTFSMKLPNFIASYLQNCDIIQCRYFLKVMVKTSSFTDDMIDETEIAIGLVPIDSDLDVRITHPKIEDLPLAPMPIDTEDQHINQPSYNYGVNAFPNLQICPPEPGPWKTFNENIQNPTMFPPLPNIVPGFVPYPPVQSTFPNVPMGQSSQYPPEDDRVIDSPPPPYSSLSFSPQPSAPAPDV